MLKRKKRMIVWLSSIVLMAVLMVGGKMLYDSVDWYKMQFKREIAHLSDDELMLGIRECDTALYWLEKEIDSEETTPEERFEARRGYKSISEQREILIRELKKREKRKSKGINNSHQ